MIGETSRRAGLWIVDALKGGDLRKEYKDFCRDMKQNGISEEKREMLLSSLLFHAKNTTEYYNGLKGNTIDEFPVLTKSDIKNDYEKFLSSKFLNAKNNHTMSTSGSTGTPFTVVQDARKRNRVLSELMYFNKIVGQKVGQRFVFLRCWTEWDTGNKLSFWSKNEVPIDISRLDDENMEKIRARLLKDPKINELMGYASTFKSLLKYAERKKDTPDMYHFNLIVSGSEMMEPVVRAGLKEVFGCNVVSRYSNQENGVIGQQCKNYEEYHMNTVNYYIELLKIDTDEPAEVGEVGRIVVTDLYNYAMPLIRYDTGDLAVQKINPDCNWNTMLLENIQGRRVSSCYLPDGTMLSPFVFDKAMEQFNKIQQFQFIQDDENEYTLVINDPQINYSDSDYERMLKELLGNEANFSVKHVDDIPCCASGKYMQMICNYKKEKGTNEK